ncbi:Rpn family recombination-promoting nuclease/putative transposase [Oceanobacillus alkalisoli]|uniref:Rpn family recombination-promoting nuclease/putative transposase n=1 Tax=Oceanobacillus alkalisoli TaxID=2925113 RepID=UPI001EE45DCB|nr:Rpn family recombination-promoting nuclease/putative transposase [Oceanobacillus alkalisoli]MCG5102258.1 Rpn family recombination-promoting nuclease/putative transposase [Oceanobacillus alkalisoli]
MHLTTLQNENTPLYAATSIIMEESSNYEKQARKRSKTTLLKQLPIDRLMDLKVDFAFKQLFGNEKNKEIMIVFLNAILQKTGRNPIKDITFLNIEAGGEFVDDKQSRLDLLVTTEDKEQIHVEIQFTNKYDMVKRSIYYWAGVYRSPLRKSMSYKELQTVISINILNFNLFNDTEKFHTTYHLFEDEEKFKLTDVMEFHFIEMPKLIKAWKEGKLDPWNDVLARWLLMLGMIDRRNEQIYEDIFHELEEIAMKDESLKKAFGSWEELSMSPEEYFAYESRLKRIFDEEAAQREAELRLREAEKKAVERGLEEGREEGRKEGRAEGREEGRKEGRKEGKKEGKREGRIEGREKGREEGQFEEKLNTAKRLLEADMDIEFIRNVTGLPAEQIMELR